jgi:integrase/recombinase XerD
MISEYRDWLRSRTSRDGRPFQDDAVSAYADAAIALDAWMTAEKIGGDFTACDTAMLNRFFAAYFAAHGQGGTNTKQRNLRHLLLPGAEDSDVGGVHDADEEPGNPGGLIVVVPGLVGEVPG